MHFWAEPFINAFASLNVDFNRGSSLRRAAKCSQLLSMLLLVFTCNAQASHKLADSGWPEYGGDGGGQRYSAARQIDISNVSKLQVAWRFHTHALDGPSNPQTRKASFEATPILWQGKLYFDTPFDAVFALDAVTGGQKWIFDPKLDRSHHLYNVASRGVSLWHAPHAKAGICGANRIFVATLDMRLIALDADRGMPCPQFGVGGTVDLTRGVEITPYAISEGLYTFTSAPTVVGNTVILGSVVGDNQNVFVASGAVRGFDATSGKQIWSWDPLPWAGGNHSHKSGSGNAWAPLSADLQNDLVFVPTGSASTDFYGGLRPGDNRDADSLVALRASSGKKVWSYQLVHHDLWDYDLASQPLLFTFRNNIPAVAVTTKHSMVFVFNRLTGEPLFPIRERPVPQSTIPGEHTSPTQPFSSLPNLTSVSFSGKDLHLSNPDSQKFCKQWLSSIDNQGVFTPPSLRGALIYPGDLGGANWGSSSLDPSTNILYTRVSELPFVVRERSREDGSSIDKYELKLKHHLPTWLGGEPPALSNEFKTPDAGGEQRESSPQTGTPYELVRRVLSAPDGTPCAPGPFGSIVATDLNSGKQLWSVPHGQMVPGASGSYGIAGTITTAGGLIFVASTNDAYLRAYDERNGHELWKGALPVPSEATPMTYTQGGRQFVVIAAGGHGFIGKKLSDEVIAFTLPLKNPS